MKKIILFSFCFLSIYLLQTTTKAQEIAFPVSNMGGYVTDFCFPNVTTGYAVGWSGMAYKTIDGGDTWTKMNLPLDDYLSIYFTSQDIGYANGFGNLYKTIDGGITWTKNPNSFYYYRNKIKFWDSNIGYTFGDWGIKKTTDAGSNWNTISSQQLRDVYFLDVSISIGVAGKSILKTINGGLTWTTIYSASPQNLNSIYFSSATKGIAVGERGVILKTADGGATWNIINSGTNSYLSSVYFTDSNTGYIGKDTTAQILKTVDGGNTWSIMKAGTTNNHIAAIKYPFIASVGTPSMSKILPLPIIAITYPTTNSTVFCTTTNITWTTQNNNPYFKVKVEYTSTGASATSTTGWTTIADNYANTGICSWNVPILSAPNCAVRITGIGYPEINATSQTFSIGSLIHNSISNPVANSTLQTGAKQTITWTSNSPQQGYTCANVKIDYSIDGGSNWTTISASTPNDGSYENWVVPDLTSTNFIIRISDVTYPTVITDQINFKVKNNIQLTINDPYANKTLVAGQSYMMKWNLTDNEPNYDIYSVNIKQCQGATCTTIASGVPFDKAGYYYTPSSATTCDPCSLVLSDVKNPNTITYTSPTFKIKTVAIPFKSIELYSNVTAPSDNPQNLIQKGKKLRFKIQATNNYTQNLMTLKGAIRTAYTGITVTDSLGTFNNLGVGQSAYSNDEFEIMVNDIPADGVIEFVFTMRDEIVNTVTWTSYFHIIVPQLDKVLINDDKAADSNGNANGIAEAGETIEILPFLKTGIVYSIDNLTAQLISDDSKISVWNNRWGATDIVKNIYNVGSDMVSDWDFVADLNSGVPASLPFTLIAQSTTKLNGNNVVVKAGLPFVLQNGNPIIGDGKKIQVNYGNVRLNRIEFYENVIASPNNPQNILAPGRKVRFKVNVKSDYSNGGPGIHPLKNYRALKGTITCSDPTLVITDNTVSFNNLLASGSIWSSDEFEVQIPQTLPENALFNLILSFADDFSDNYSLGNIDTEGFNIPLLQFAMTVIDDDNNPDSKGNDNDIAEQGESVELIPLIKNTSSTTFYGATGVLSSQPSYIKVWDNKQGASGLVYNTYKYNVTGGTQNPISGLYSGQTAQNILPEFDFVFDHSGTATYSLGFNLLITAYAGSAAGATWDQGGTKMIFNLPFTMNNGQATEPILITAPYSGEQIGKGVVASILASAFVTAPVTVSKVDFYVDGTLIGSDNTDPYSYNWNTGNATLGNHTLKAVMTNSSNATFTTEVTVKLVENQYIPAINFVTPTAGATYLQGDNVPVNVTATVSTPVAVSKIELYDGATLLTTLFSTPYLYSWNSTLASAGAHDLVAVVYTNNGQTYSSIRTLSLTANPNLPTLAITSPKANQEFAPNAMVTLSANATTPTGKTISKIDFYIDDVLVNSDNASPYTYDWNSSSAQAGAHAMKAVMTMSDNISYSQTVNFSLLSSQNTVSVKMGEGMTFTLPEASFASIPVAKRQFSYTMEDGSAVPSWLTFNPATMTFSGTVPPNTPSQILKIKVTCNEAGKKGTVVYYFNIVIIGTGIEESQLGNSFKVYPNPTTGSITIDLQTDFKKSTIQIYDMQGKLIKTITNPTEKTNVFLKNKGMYIAKVITPKGMMYKKVIVE